MARATTGSRQDLIVLMCFAVPLIAFAAAVNSYGVAARNAAQYPDTYGVSRAEVRFASLAERVPPSERLGYITDIDPASPAYSAAFLAAQYALAPRRLSVLGKGRRPALSVGNFSRPQDYAAAGGNVGYEVAADLGNGVILFRRESP